MADRFGYTQGRCLICGEDKKVRHKNLYLIGSEGTMMCVECELDLLKYLRKKQIKFTKKRIKLFKKKKEKDLTS
jgi:hypothetical protein